MAERIEKPIETDDLPPEETLTPEEKERIAGAGRQSFRPTFDALEARELMTGGIAGALAVPPVGDVHKATLPQARAPTVEMPAALFAEPEQATKQAHAASVSASVGSDIFAGNGVAIGINHSRKDFGTTTANYINETHHNPADAGVFVSWEHSEKSGTTPTKASLPDGFLNTCKSNNVTPMFTWMPGDEKTSGARNMLPDIVAGKSDAYIARMAMELKDHGGTVLVRFGHEMNLSNYSYAGHPEDYQKAFRHVVDLFREAGADNVKFVWCPNNYTNAGPGPAGSIDLKTAQAYYPGDKYVDIVAFDAYPGPHQDGMKFADVIRGPYGVISKVAPNKPVMVAETGTGGSEKDKIAFFNSMKAAIESGEFRNLRAINYFDINRDPQHFYYDKTKPGFFERNWRVDQVYDKEKRMDVHSDKALAAWKEVLESAGAQARYVNSSPGQATPNDAPGNTRALLTGGNAAAAAEAAPATDVAQPLPEFVKYKGASDASAALVVGGGKYMFVGDDKGDVIRLYDTTAGGKPVASMDVSKHLGTTFKADGTGSSSDLEGVTRVGDMAYWIGSGGDGKSNVIVATRVIEEPGKLPRLEYVGKYTGMREAIAGTDFKVVKDGKSYTLQEMQAKAMNRETKDWYGIEGIVMKPGDTTAYIAFRGAVGDKGAMLLPVTNFTKLFAGDNTTPKFGKPIQLDLGGRGIRDIVYHAEWDKFVLIGGNAGTGNLSSLIYVWDGSVDKNGRGKVFPLSTEGKKDPEGRWMSFEAIGQITGKLADGTGKVQVLSDDGGSAHGKNTTFDKRYFHGHFYSVPAKLVSDF